MMKRCNFLWRKKTFLWTRVLDIDLCYAITGLVLRKLPSQLKYNLNDLPHPQQKHNNYINKKWLKLFLTENRNVNGTVVSFSLYLVLCMPYACVNYFQQGLGSFVHSSLQIFRCFIKHNTKEIFFKIVSEFTYLTTYLYLNCPTLCCPLLSGIVLSTVIYSTIIMRCRRDAVNFAWLLQNFDTVILAIIINLNALSQICEPNMYYLKTI